MLLVTGPTGSGKTTTLYAALTRLNDRKRNVMTVEDPIEYELAGIAQTQVNPRTDMTFARGLRAILRQDPDVIMVGEIRDQETARGRGAIGDDRAFRAVDAPHQQRGRIDHAADRHGGRALSARADAGRAGGAAAGAAAVPRLQAGRCRERCRCGDAGRGADAPATRCGARSGCDACHGDGYRGRDGVYEVVAVDDAFQAMIHDGASEAELERVARANNPSLLDDGVAKVRAGVTTVEEVARVTRDEG